MVSGVLWCQPVLAEADVHVDAVGPDVHVIDAGQVPGHERGGLGVPRRGELGDHRGGQAAGEPRNWPSAGTKSPQDRPCRYSSGSTSVTFGVLRAQAGRIAEENRARCPVTGSVRLSFTRGAV